MRDQQQTSGGVDPRLPVAGGGSSAGNLWKPRVFRRTVAPDGAGARTPTLRSMDAVKQAHACWGQPDIFAFVEVADEPTLADVVLTAIQGFPGIRTTETHIVVPV